MYFRTSQFPALKRLPRAEQRAIIVAALEKHARGISWRFWIALALIVVLAVGLGYLSILLRLPPWTTLAEAVAVGALFYGYLIWEINGPVQRAVNAYLAKK